MIVMNHLIFSSFNPILFAVFDLSIFPGGGEERGKNALQSNS